MLTKRARILCIGKDPGLLRTRVAVLKHAGYDAQAAMFLDADVVLRTGELDLIILSAILKDAERAHIISVVGGRTSILVLKEFIWASDLLAEVDRRIRHVRSLQLFRSTLT